MSRSKYRPGLSVGGPRWFRRATRTVPLRREASRALHRFLSGRIDVVLLTPSNRRTTWWL